MNTVQNKSILFLLLVLFFSNQSFSQEHLSTELGYEVYRVYPYVSIDEGVLNGAINIADLNKDYDPAWVSEYISVEIAAIHNGNIKKAVSENDRISQEQMAVMHLADAGTSISVMVRYIPDNSLSHNDPKETSFTLFVSPEKEAVYPGGPDMLKQYLKEKAVDKIPAGTITGYELTVVKFTVTEEGEIVNSHVFESSRNTEVDELLLTTISNMSCWEPAEYSDGTKIKQDFVLTVGNMESCIVHLLSLDREMLYND